MTRSIAIRRPATPRRRRAFLPQAEGLEGRRLLNAGDLDLSFGSGGYTLADQGGARAVRLQSDGKILAAGRSGDGNDFRLVRLSSSGAPDLTFGPGGSVTTDFAGQADLAQDMVILRDGRIVVVGRAGNIETRLGKGNKPVTYSNDDIGLACYFSVDTTIVEGPYKGNYTAGALDPRFGTGGKVTTDISTFSSTNISNKFDEALGAIVQEDGMIVVGGQTATSSGYDALLARYFSVDTTDSGGFHPAGSLDSTFGQNGIVRIPQVGNDTRNGVWDLALLRDPSNPANDKIVTLEAPMSSSGQYTVMVARYNLNGSPDMTFSTDGRSDIVTLPSSSLGAWGMALQPDGFGGYNAVVTGYNNAYPVAASNGSFLLRYTNTGTLDPTFGTGGIALFGAATGDTGYSVAIQPNGKIVVAGTSNTTPGSFVARFETSGAIDTTFGTNGSARSTFTNSGSIFQSSHSLILQPDGKIVAVGAATTTTGSGRRLTSVTNFLIARYQGDPVTSPLAANVGIGSATSTDSSVAMGQSEVLVPSIDPYLAQLGTEVILSRPKRRGSQAWISLLAPMALYLG